MDAWIQTHIYAALVIAFFLGLLLGHLERQEIEEERRDERR